MYCRQCGKQIQDTVMYCVHCGMATGSIIRPLGAKSRVAYVLFGIFLGELGIHNFYAGYTNKAVTQLLVTVLTGWLIIPVFAIWIWAIVEVCTVTQDSTGQKFT